MRRAWPDEKERNDIRRRALVSNRRDMELEPHSLGLKPVMYFGLARGSALAEWAQRSCSDPNMFSTENQAARVDDSIMAPNQAMQLAHTRM